MTTKTVTNSYTVTCSMDDKESVYSIDTIGYYDAKVEGLRRFMEENEVPGTPTQFLSSKTGLIKVTVKCENDRRRSNPSAVRTIDFYLDRLDFLRKAIRTGELPDSVKTECQKKLYEVRSIISGQRAS